MGQHPMRRGRAQVQRLHAMLLQSGTVQVPQPRKVSRVCRELPSQGKHPEVEQDPEHDCSCIPQPGVLQAPSNFKPKTHNSKP